MGTPTQYYVDPSLGSDTGDGTVGTPWGRASGSVVQYALDTGITRDATNGDQINIKSDQAVGVTTTTDDTLGASISVATYGNPDWTAPLIFRGYTSTANDGGIGGIDGAATYQIMSDVAVHFIDLHLHNCGSALILSLSTGSSAQNCEIDTTTGAAIDANSAVVIGCNIHTFGTTGLDGTGSLFRGNYISDASATMAINGEASYIEGNIISIAGATDGIRMALDNCHVIGNSILSAAGTGKGITMVSNRNNNTILNNLVEGFSGSGGVGINLGSNTENVAAYGYNAVEDCATDYSAGTTDFANDYGDNESLGASPFAKSGSDTFANRFTYFAPVDTGNVIGGALQ